jgi:hypothetical protein
LEKIQGINVNTKSWKGFGIKKIGLKCNLDKIQGLDVKGWVEIGVYSKSRIELEFL